MTRTTASSLLYFLFYSVLGWCYEVFLEVVVYRWGFSNRGFLFGPYCIVYGVGALLPLFTLGGLTQTKIRLGPLPITPLLVFLGIVAITTGVELVASYLMEWVTGSWMWDYTRFAFHFQGRIALNPSLRFGVGGMVILYLLHPPLERMVQRIPLPLLKKLAWAEVVLLAVDAGCRLLLS